MRLDKKTILQIIPRLESGGAEKIAVQSALGVHKAGGRSLVASQGGAMSQELLDAGCDVIILPLASKNPAQVFANIFRLKSLIKKEQINVVHAHSRMPAWSAYWATRQTKTPFLTTYHGAYSQKNGLKAGYNSVMAKGDIVIAHSNHTANLVRDRHLKFDDPRLVTLGCGIDITRFDPSLFGEAAKGTKRQAWGVSKDRFIVLHPARLSSIKGQVEVLNAAHLMAQRGQISPFHFVFLGDHQGRTAYLNQLKQMVADLDLGAYVTFAGHETNMPLALAAGDLVLNPSKVPETFGLSVAEAMAMERPVIVSGGGALPEVLLYDDQNTPVAGDIIGAVTGELIAASIQKVFDRLKSSLEIKEGTALRHHIIAHYSLEQMQTRTNALYVNVKRG